MKISQVILLVLVTWWGSSCSSVRPITWPLESVASVGGHTVTISGNPQVVKQPTPAIAFDGIDDGLLVHANPIVGAEEFTIEVEFKPRAAWPANVEQRFLHIEDLALGQRRLLLELRLNNRGQWYADFFMRTEKAALTLIDSTQAHPVGEWATMTMVYKDKKLQGYVNGRLELSGDIEYLPIPASANTSIGTRMDQRSWFNGEIRSVKAWPKAILPKQ
ncbi:hypothetical protein TH63_04640 [Rufibacter radiotolerans]|uniref:LamG domain-containing protein n=1 Tax=Rufibacter radiotolerans TaxID=1379910 RepID=A0A0H4VMH9_9BACT|nr:LamG-like jellyroll fold domain-containing protein [Rufibacter radiotolerans]AKQ45082.1 hypothetical protein TH63_04640 [Rufibacter radiotolerans]